MTVMRQVSLRLAIAVEQREQAQPAKPFVKWVGGKRSLLPELQRHMPNEFRNYYEPFLGGGALFFELNANGTLNDRSVFLSDMNFDLIHTYQEIKRDVEPLIVELHEHARNHSKEYYYQIRSEHDLDDRVLIAARMIYLNKTCFNGLWRVNRKGEFNVPIGSYKNPKICHESNLRACHVALAKVDVRMSDFAAIKAGKDDFVYFDPPYHPIDQTSFTSYYKSSFGWEEQIALRDFSVELETRGAKVMISNSDTPFIREIYESFNIIQVQAPRLVNSKADKRGLVNELLITNF